MPMVVHEPGPHQLAVSRSGREPSIGSSSPPAALLPSGAASAPDALRLRRGLRHPHRRPEPWSDEAFAREADLVRRHLAPLRNRRSLTASFSREAFHALELDPFERMPLGPIRAAYAIRWLELGSGAHLPAWTNLLLAARTRSELVSSG
jgi:hypothetical protein